MDSSSPYAFIQPSLVAISVLQHAATTATWVVWPCNMMTKKELLFGSEVSDGSHINLPIQ